MGVVESVFVGLFCFRRLALNEMFADLFEATRPYIDKVLCVQFAKNGGCTTVQAWCQQELLVLSLVMSREDLEWVLYFSIS